MKTLNNNTQILNVHYNQNLAPDALNKIFHSLFTAGVIAGSFDFGLNTVTINSVSFLIYPQNKSDLLVRIDTTTPVTLTNTSTSNIYLIARYRWENANQGAEFLFVDDANVVGTDVILVGINLDIDGTIYELDYDVQERARLKVIQSNTAFTLISKLDGYGAGHDADEIPLADGTVNTHLNAEYFNGKEITEMAVSKELPTYTVDEGGATVTVLPTYPDWMDTEAVDLGEGITAEYVVSKKIQPQDGVTAPTTQNQIPVANTVLQKDLNTEFLGGHLHSEFSKIGHTHSLDDIEDGIDGPTPTPTTQNRVIGVKSNYVTSDSILPDGIDYNAVDMLAYDSTVSYWYQPIYETGQVVLTGVAEATVTFDRPFKNPRIFLQRVPKATEIPAAGTEKRSARLTEVTDTYFKCKQMGSILKSGANYIRSDAADAGTNNYYYFVVGSWKEV